ncbi:psbp domain-containing protein 3 chloroplastic [Phtheirospermum japonicum]|uniref:Psbp domain-containing protein 3 chloroplastic n=1 Tax=Phtheirospermum japonicum TaxID=374723 RepID=A0A830BUA4_9LAMI|nr:psbp domain-containing protein 3 chloroplastic [Phtheirospermum japonicum]
MAAISSSLHSHFLLSHPSFSLSNPPPRQVTTSVALAAESDLPESFRVYTDEVNKFKITIPQVSIAITGLGADFTRLESFGKVDAFAETLIGGLDRSWQRPPGVAAKLIDSKAANGLYYIEYTLKSPGESRRHLLSVLGIANNGIYNRLYTLTGQFVDEEEEKFGTKIQKAVSSFRLF